MMRSKQFVLIKKFLTDNAKNDDLKSKGREMIHNIIYM